MLVVRATRRREGGATHLGREVVRRAAQRPRGALAMLREPEVSDFNVPVEVEEDVLGLEVAVDDVERVQVVERERDLGRVELRHWVGESLANV